MKPHLAITFVVFASVVVCGSPARAQTSARAYFDYGNSALSSKQSFEAVTGTSRAMSIGGGASVSGLIGGVFVDFAFSQQRLSGERVFTEGGQVYGLGIPAKIVLRPIDIAGGWRYQRGRISPYAGGGLTVMSYRETSDFAAEVDNVTATKSGPMVLGGIDVRMARLLSIGGEARFRQIKGILGSSGVSQVFHEDQLGGISLNLRVSVGN
jgi:hypothetical protein